MNIQTINFNKKNKTIHLVVVLFFLASFGCYSQNVLKGRIIQDKTEEVIPFVNVLVKTFDNTLIDYTITNENGDYSIELPANYQKLKIETSIISHLSSRKEIIIIPQRYIYKLNFTLKERLTELEEVYIESKKKPIIVKKDTTVYNINLFKDGSEQVIEDLLKKLPGIAVNENGIIKFKGKQVTRVLLDGDNLFDSNYSIGTKNIDSEIIESIQAIEDYNINPLLKGIKSSEDVAINLLLKKGKSDISGNSEIGLGAKEKKLLKVNTISVSKKLKGFSTVSYNNIGKNYSPYKFASNNIELSKINELEQRTNNLVNGSGFNSNLPVSRTSVNDNFFGSINALYKINKKSSFRANYNLFKDKLTRGELYNTVYNFDNQQLNISNGEKIIKKPLINTFQYELIYNINKKSLLTSIGKMDSQTVETRSEGFNNDSNFENTSNSKDTFFNNNSEYTYRINSKKVFQISSKASINKIPQSINIINGNEIFEQKINFKKNTFNIKSSLLTKSQKREYSFTLGYNFNENFITSNLQGIAINNQILSNNLYYRLAKPYFNITHQFRVNKWKFSTILKTELVYAMINDVNLETNFNKSFFVFNPSFFTNYYLSKDSHLYFDYNLSNKTPESNNVYSGLILTNIRTLLNNDFNFNLFNNHSSTIGYRINDFYNLFQFNLYGRFNFRKYGYINKLNVNEDRDFYTTIVDVTDNKRLDFGLDFEKYIHFLKSTININSTYTINEYQNIINNSNLRNNKNNSFFSQFYIRTGFKSKVNFSNKTLFRINKFKTPFNNNSVTSFQNDFSIKYIKNSFQFGLNSQYFKPDLKSNISGGLFLDTSIVYKSKNSKIEYKLIANNLLDKKVYRNINNTDFSSSIFEHNLIERFILLSVNFKF